MARDVVVIGGGPAGCATAIQLAQQGRDVVLLDRERFPRYHIGESMIPYCYFPLKKLGLLEAMKHSAFVKKYSVQFVSTEGQLSQPFYFSKHLDHECSTTWQVVRSEFDQMMMDQARHAGVDIRENTSAISFLENENSIIGVKTKNAEGQEEDLYARLTIDASGRDGFSLSKLKWRERDEELNRVALWSYIKGAKRDPGMDAGATTVAYLPEKGWFWYIPLPNDIVSVGCVAKKDYLYRETNQIEDIYRRELEFNPWIKEHTECGEIIEPVRVTGEYSYRSRHCSKNGLLLTGDAFAFLDPVFSSGLFLALQGGILAAEAAESALKENNTQADQFKDYGDKICAYIEAFRKLVYAFYDPNFSFKDLVMAKPELRGDVTDLLIGHLEKDFTNLNEALKEFAEIPEELQHGRPLVEA